MHLLQHFKQNLSDAYKLELPALTFESTEHPVPAECFIAEIDLKIVSEILNFRFNFQIMCSNVKSIRYKFITKIQIAFILFCKLTSKIPQTVLQVNVC